MAGLRIRRGTAAQWAAANPILDLGRLGVETDTRFIKVGDGATAWNSLPYISRTSKRTTYTPTFVGFGTVTSVDFSYVRLEDLIIIKGYFVSGTPTAVVATISLPTGLTGKSATANYIPCGGLWWHNGSANSVKKWLVRYADASNVVTFGNEDSVTGVSPFAGGINGNSLVGTTVAVAVQFEVPITQWA